MPDVKACGFTSISTGGTFSPPAVMISSLMRPVMRMNPLCAHEKKIQTKRNRDSTSTKTWDCLWGYVKRMVVLSQSLFLDEDLAL